MKAKNFVALVLIAMFVFALASADQKAKQATDVKKETKSCCMDAKATKASNEKSATGTMTAKHEHGKGMECKDGEKCTMATKASMTSDDKASAHATNAKHEHGKGMEACADGKECKDKDGKMSSNHGKDCCKEMTKAENTKSDTKSESAAPKE